MGSSESISAHTTGANVQDPDDDKPDSSRDIETANGENPRAKYFLGEPMSVLHELVFFAVVGTANFTPHCGFHQCLSILHIIARDLDATEPGQQVWLMAGYGLTWGTFILLAGRLGDIYGYKRVFLLGNLWFSLFSLLAGFAMLIPSHPNSQARYTVFLLSRILQGIGPAIIVPNGVALLGVTYAPGHRKSMAFAIFGALAPASAIISPAVTGLFNLIWWPYAFWAFAIVLVGVAFAGFYTIPEPERPGAVFETNKNEALGDRSSKQGFWALCEELDALGGMIGVTGMILISVAWNQGSLAGWASPYVPVLLAVGIALCVAFVMVEKRVKNPLIPLDALNTGVSLVLIAAGCAWGCFGIYIYYIWNFYEVLRGASPLLATAWHSPIFVSGITAALTMGFVIHRVGPAVMMTVALLAFTIGTSLIATAPIHQSYWLQTFFCNVIITWGMDLCFPVSSLMISDLVLPEHQGIGASLVNTVINYSAALALGVAGTVEINVNNGGKTPEDILKGYRGAWYLGIGLSVVGLLVSLVFVFRKPGLTHRVPAAAD